MWLPLVGSIIQPTVGQKGFSQIVRNNFWMKDRNSHLCLRSLSVMLQHPVLGAEPTWLPELSSSDLPSSRWNAAWPVPGLGETEHRGGSSLQS